MIVWVYEFADGTKLKLLEIGLSVEELWALKDIHGDLLSAPKAERI